MDTPVYSAMRDRASFDQKCGDKGPKEHKHLGVDVAGFADDGSGQDDDIK